MHATKSSIRKTIGVIGGGSAGLSAARVARRLGARVLFFMGDNADEASLCVNRGCMPSKALFQPIDEMHHARRRGFFEVAPRRPESLLEQIVTWRDREIARFRAFRQKKILELAGDDFQQIRANARFHDPHTLESRQRRYEVDAVIIATGSHPNLPPIDGIEELRDEVWTSDRILANKVLPESLVVVGGGPNGLELSLRYARLGCRVTLVSRSRFLPRQDGEAGERLARIYENEGIRVLTNHSASRLRKDAEGWFVLDTEGPHGSEPIVGERILFTTGRRPSLAGLNLEASGLDLEDGHPRMGDDLRFAGQRHIFAAGDANGRRMVVHQAHIEAGIAAENAVQDGERRWTRIAGVECVFTDPEFASAGMTLDQAKNSRHAIVTATVDSRQVGKLHLAGDDAGAGSMIADRNERTLLGAWLLCDAASDLIHLPAYAIHHGDTIDDIVAAEFYHPTKVEIVSRIADRLEGMLGGRSHPRGDE